MVAVVLQASVSAPELLHQAQSPVVIVSTRVLQLLFAHLAEQTIHTHGVTDHTADALMFPALVPIL